MSATADAESPGPSGRARPDARPPAPSSGEPPESRAASPAAAAPDVLALLRAAVAERRPAAAERPV